MDCIVSAEDRRKRECSEVKMEPNIPILYPVHEYGSTGRKEIADQGRRSGNTWAFDDWENAILREPEELERFARTQFREDFTPLVDRDYFTDDLEECQRLYVAAFQAEYQQTWNNRNEQLPFYRYTYHIHVEKREIKDTQYKYTFHLYDYLYLGSGKRLAITFNKEGGIVTFEELDE
jgi:hypothetical protein